MRDYMNILNTVEETGTRAWLVGPLMSISAERSSTSLVIISKSLAKRVKTDKSLTTKRYVAQRSVLHFLIEDTKSIVMKVRLGLQLSIQQTLM